MPEATLLGRQEFGFCFKPDGFVAIFGAALFEPEFTGASGDVIMGDHVFDVRIHGRRWQEG
jgi:hypothetical protein